MFGTSLAAMTSSFFLASSSVSALTCPFRYSRSSSMRRSLYCRLTSADLTSSAATSARHFSSLASASCFDSVCHSPCSLSTSSCLRSASSNRSFLSADS